MVVGGAGWSRNFRVAIIGRPNVGKSSLFNRLCGKQIALVYDKPGVTRDSIEGTAFIGGLEFQLTDTAGLDDGGDLQGEGMHIEKVGSLMAASGIGRWPTHLLTKALLRTEQVVQESDVVLFLVDAKFGVTPVDIQFARWVNKQGRPALLLANKSEGNIDELRGDDLHLMGMGEPLYCSVTQNEGVSQLITMLSPLASYFSDPSVVGTSGSPEKFPRVLILGRPNVGKSTLVNALIDVSQVPATDGAGGGGGGGSGGVLGGVAGKSKVLVGPEPGVTRDPVSVFIYHKLRRIELIDTAGLRKKAKTMLHGDVIDIKTSNATLRKLKETDVAVLMLDASEASMLLTSQDLIIANEVITGGKALVIAVNKTDLLTKGEIKALIRDQSAALGSKLPQLGECPVVMMSAEKGSNISLLVDTVLKSHDTWRSRVSTTELMRWITDLKRIGKMGGQGHPNPKFARQVDTGPPTFVILCTRAAKSSAAYMAFLTNSLRATFNLHGVPVRVVLRDANAAARQTATAEVNDKNRDFRGKQLASPKTKREEGDKERASERTSFQSRRGSSVSRGRGMRGEGRGGRGRGTAVRR